MKYFLFLFFFSSAITFGFAQSNTTIELKQYMDSHLDELIPIRIEFIKNVDCYNLNEKFKAQNTTLDKRVKKVNEVLINQSYESQHQILDFFKSKNIPNSNIKSFWIVNIIVALVDYNTIIELEQFKNILFVDLENNEFIPYDEFKIEEFSSKQPNGVENGLVAINAPAMWALGYTGKGRLAYNYDTGVWPTHPAFKERFIGNRYPMNQSWIGYFNSFPNGSVQNHGTHTLGTIAGLIKSTNDTIGVAFGSYWIANDFVTSTVQGLPPIVNMIEAFEWALNPDNDTSTTWDVPDVINNSWRWYDGNDTIHCNGFVVNLMNAIEAAGIANVFSGGNSGPNNSTVNSPQRINTSEVNTFSVGSINGNLSFPYAISNFSTRGPIQCPGIGSLIIHPEVVAPGQGVRSAWGIDDFNTISGTSMAAPHVSGAILLLKEAFPYLSGEDLLWALYLTAIDMGDPGEDNTFGMGLIDVYAAFQYLSSTNTPIDPIALNYDLALDSIKIANISSFTCENNFSPTINFSNKGDFTINSVDFKIKVNGIVIQNFSWTGTLSPQSSANIIIPSITIQGSGEKELQIIGEISNSSSESDYFNNSVIKRFSIVNEFSSLPFIEHFENGITDSLWVIENEDADLTWVSDSTEGLNWSSKSACIKLYSYSPRDNQKDGLLTPKITLSNNTDLFLTFDIAYQQRSPSNVVKDTFKIYLSNNCGNTFDFLIYEKFDNELSTLDTVKHDFIPQYSSHWRNDTVDLSLFSGEDVIVKFETINRQGNNLYLDNIKIFEGQSAPVGISNSSNTFKIFPNPARELIQLSSSSLDLENYTLKLYNSFGQLVQVEQLRNANNSISTLNFPVGMYFIQLFNNEKSITKSFLKW
ncbi:MAG: S8 family serine peptidase [Flavobacteriales bacterium]|nr:S8 family serine peptidase [Flavobacteriales bacterium]